MNKLLERLRGLDPGDVVVGIGVVITGIVFVASVALALTGCGTEQSTRVEVVEVVEPAASASASAAPCYCATGEIIQVGSTDPSPVPVEVVSPTASPTACPSPRPSALRDYYYRW